MIKKVLQIVAGLIIGWLLFSWAVKSDANRNIVKVEIAGQRGRMEVLDTFKMYDQSPRLEGHIVRDRATGLCYLNQRWMLAPSVCP